MKVLCVSLGDDRRTEPRLTFNNSQVPYVRWQRNGQPLDIFGNKLPSAKDPAAHIPLGDFTFLLELFQ